MKSLEAVRGVRIALYIGTLLALLFTEDGRSCHLIGLAVTVIALVMYWLERPQFFRLVMMWCLGFLLIITGEGLLDRESIVHSLGRATYDEASRYVVAAHVATLLGHSFVFSEAGVRPVRLAPPLNPAVAMPLLIVSMLIALLHMVPLALQGYASGRSGQEVQVASVGGVLLQGIATSASVGVPIVATWLARHARGTRRMVLLAFTFGILALQFVIAVRFLLLFAAVGAAVVWIAPRRPSGRVLAAAAAMALLLSAASTIMGNTRTVGLGESDVGEAAGEVGIDSFVFKEGVVQTLGLAVTYTRIRGFTDGASSSAVLVFWIPRTLWPGKPTLTGYWLPRAFTTSGFSEGFSAAQGFAGNAYLDFGFTGGVTFWLLAGIVFGLIERSAARILLTDGDPRIIFVAPLFGGSFFAVRSVDTTALVLVGVFLYMIAAIALTTTRARSHRGVS